MKKNLIIILVIVAVAIAGIFVFSSKSKQGEETISPAQPAEEMTQTEEPATIEEPEDKIEEPESRPSNALSLGGSYRCTYTIENGMQVTTYVKNGKMRT